MCKAKEDQQQFGSIKKWEVSEEGAWLYVIRSQLWTDPN
jgi:hypothetical protein